MKFSRNTSIKIPLHIFIGVMSGAKCQQVIIKIHSCKNDLPLIESAQKQLMQQLVPPNITVLCGDRGNMK